MSSPSKAVDVLLRLDVLIHTLPLLVADANKAGGNLSATRTVAELREARDAIVELIAAATALRRTHPTYSIAYGQAEQRLDAALSTIGESQ